MADPHTALNRLDQLVQELLDERFGPVPEHERIPARLPPPKAQPRKQKQEK